jgi:hypothetical protein
MLPDQGMDHPACGGVLPRVARWVGNGRGMVLADWTEAGRSRGRDEPTDGHPHPSGHHACGRLAIARGGDTRGGFADATPTRRLGVACIAGAAVLGGPQGRAAAPAHVRRPRVGPAVPARGPGVRRGGSTGRGAWAWRGAESTRPPRWATPPAVEVTPCARAPAGRGALVGGAARPVAGTRGIPGRGVAASWWRVSAVERARAASRAGVPSGVGHGASGALPPWPTAGASRRWPRRGGLRTGRPAWGATLHSRLTGVRAGRGTRRAPRVRGLTAAAGASARGSRPSTCTLGRSRGATVGAPPRRVAAVAARRRARAVPPSSSRVSQARPRAAAGRGAGATRGAMRRAGG